ncbi:MAG: undecaprenyl-diphosphatase UppP [Elusimicrobiota bacterium]|jgi:undecaprenyl-diphosphatase
MTLDIPHSFALGVLQGLTEFLPVSSSAHLALFPRFFGWTDPGLAFDVALHLGTLAGVVAYFRKELWRFVEGLLHFNDSAYEQERRTVLFLLLATVPGALAGFLFEQKVETVFRNPKLIAIVLIVMGVALGFMDRFFAGQKRITDLSVTTAVGVGMAQALALMPGVSRSGITITVALALGFAREEAAHFSFLLSIPIIAGAGIFKSRELWLSPEKGPLVVGFLGAAVAGLAAIAILMRYVQKHRYTPFILYRWALGTFVLLNLSRFL